MKHKNPFNFKAGQRVRLNPKSVHYDSHKKVWPEKIQIVEKITPTNQIFVWSNVSGMARWCADNDKAWLPIRSPNKI